MGACGTSPSTVEVVFADRGDREVEFCFSHPFPRDVSDLCFSKVFVEAVDEDALGGPGAVGPHPRVVQGGKHVGDAGGGGERHQVPGRGGWIY